MSLFSFSEKEKLDIEYTKSKKHILIWFNDENQMINHLEEIEQIEKEGYTIITLTNRLALLRKEE